MWEYQCQMGRVVDGDTVDLLVDTGFYQRVQIRTRLRNVDTAEIYGVEKDSEEYEEGIEHKEFVERWFSEGFVEHDGHWPFIVVSEKTGKYGRWIATIERKSDGEVLNERLLVEYPEVEYK